MFATLAALGQAMPELADRALGRLLTLLAPAAAGATMPARAR